MRELFGSVLTRKRRYYGRYRLKGKSYYTPTRQTKAEVRNDLAQIHATILNGTWTPPAQAAPEPNATPPHSTRGSTNG